MDVCLDCFSLCRLHGTGLYTYSFELVQNLLRMYPQAGYDCLVDGSTNLNEWQKAKNLTFISLEPDRLNGDYTNLTEYLIKKRTHLYHSPNNGFSLPAEVPCKTVITVHDLAPLSISQQVDKKYADNFLKKFPQAIERADKILVVSEFIKNEILKYYPNKVLENKIHVTYPGCSGRFKPLQKSACRPVLQDKYGIRGEYLLYAGSFHERKNLKVLFELFKELKTSKPGLQLVLAGKLDGKREPCYLCLKESAIELGVSDSIRFLGTVDYQDMPCLYNGAACAFNLSNYEGFPMVTVEAIACGTPVVCADSSSFREVLGDGVPLVDPDDKKSLKYLTLQLLDSPNYRQSLLSKLRRSCASYTWEKNIHKTISIYEDLVYGRR